MAKQTQKSELMGKLGDKLKKAHEAHKGDTTKVGSGGDLPEGIEGGVAQLVDCQFGQFKIGKNIGQFFFMAAGSVVEPSEHEVVDPASKKKRKFKTFGMRTKIGPEPLCETKSQSGKGRQTFDEHIDWTYNQLRLLGVNTDEIDLEENPRALEDIAEALKKAQPYFAFRTWKGTASKEYPNPRVTEEWRGLVEYTPGDDQVSAGVDETPDDDDAASPPDDSAGAAAGDDDEDLDALVTAADDEKDKPSARRLGELAKSLGVSEEDIENTNNWGEVRDLIVAAREAAGAGETKEETPEPAKSDNYLFHPIDPKTDKPRTKGITCEVVSVNKKAKSVVLKNLVDNKTQYKDVSWDDLKTV